MDVFARLTANMSMSATKPWRLLVFPALPQTLVILVQTHALGKVGKYVLVNMFGVLLRVEKRYLGETSSYLST